MGPFPWKLVTIDIDGTLTTVHGWRVIAQATGREADYETTSRRFFSRRVDESAHLAELLGLAEGLTQPELEALLEATPKIAGIGETVRELQTLGAKVALLTHNPAYVCAWYKARFGFDDFEGTPTPPLVHRRIPPSGAVVADKAGGLRRLLQRYGVPPGEVVHVGDGWADAALFPRIGGSVALNSPFPDVERSADRILHSGDLRALVPLLGSMRPRNPVNDARRNDEPLNS